jgi:hypothetical protein
MPHPKTIVYINRATGVPESTQQSLCECYLLANGTERHEWKVEYEVEGSMIMMGLMSPTPNRLYTFVVYSAETLFNGPIAAKSMKERARHFRVVCVKDRLDTGGVRRTAHSFIRSLACIRCQPHQTSLDTPKYGTFIDEDGLTHSHPDEQVSLGVIMSLRAGGVKTTRVADILNSVGLLNPRSASPWTGSMVSTVCAAWKKPLVMDLPNKNNDIDGRLDNMRDYYDLYGNQRPMRLCFF